MGKDRYGCTNHKKRLPIDGLGGARCKNSKTIKRQDVEDRVLSALPATFFRMGIFNKLAEETKKKVEAKLRSGPSEHAKRAEDLKLIEAKQKALIRQISNLRRGFHYRSHPDSRATQGFREYLLAFDCIRAGGISVL